MNRTVNAITPLGDKLRFKALKGHEQLSDLFEWTIEFVSESPGLNLQDMLGKAIAIEIETDGSPRYMHGIVTDFGLIHRESETRRYYIYEATVRPWLWYATQVTDNRIFQDQTAVEIITQVLNGYDYPVDNRLVGNYRKWGYSVQYQETDFNFISRLMEHEGIYYWFRHEKDRHVLVLMDDAHSHDPLATTPDIAYYDEDRHLVPHEEYIRDWRIAAELTSTTYSTMDYDFQKPQADMSARRWVKRQNTQGLDLDWYDPMGGYVDSADSDHYALVHLQSMQCLQEQAWSVSNVRAMAPGYLFALKHYPNRAENKTYLILRTEYHFRDSSYATTADRHARANFEIRSQHIPATVQFRAPRITPVPKMSGPQTAIVVGPEGEEIWTDAYGRIKVQFHWDRQGTMDEHSSCWLRVSNPWAGGGFGGVQIPRVREEVVVDFINGDVDRPIAVGRVYNANNMPPVSLPGDATQSGFFTRSKNGTPVNANKLLFDDRQGSEMLSMVAEKDMNTHVKNNQQHDVAGNAISSIAGLRSHTVHSTSAILMASGAIKSYASNHNRTVQSSLEDSIGGNLEQTLSDGVDEVITGQHSHTVGGSASHQLLGLHVNTAALDDETVNGTVSETIGADDINNITSNSDLDAADITLDSPSLYKESTQQDIDIQAGGNLDVLSTGPGIVQTPNNITKESPANIEAAAMLDNNTVVREDKYILKLNLDAMSDVMVSGTKTDSNIADLAFYGMGGTMQAANIGLYGANLQIGSTDTKMGLANVSITVLELDKGFKIKTMGGGGRFGYKGKHRASGGGRGPKGPKGGKHRAGRNGNAKKPHADCKECRGRIGGSIGLDVGDERFSHLDFFLPGAIPIEWNRTYRSNMIAKDAHGELGPRWLTPFTLTVLPDEDGGFEYISEVGRSVTVVSLETGEEWYDRTEELIWSRPDPDTLVVSHKYERTETFERFGDAYRLKLIADRNGNKIDLFYDEESGLLDRLETAIHTIHFSHDASGRMTEIWHETTGDEGDTEQRILAQYQYDDAGDLVLARDQYGRSYSYAYQNHLVIRYGDRTGRNINLEWDSDLHDAKCVREYRDDGSGEMRFRWDKEVPKTYVTDALGSTTIYTFDDFNYISHIDFPDGTRQSRIRDEFHNIIEVRYPDGSFENYEYDDFDNILKLTRADQTVVRWEYDRFSRVTRIVDPAGNEWRRDYDQYGNMIRETDPKGHASEFQYTADGLLIQSVNPRGGVSTLSYSAAGLLIRYSDCSNKTRRWEYDQLGRLVRQTDPCGNAETYAYNEFGFISEVQRPDGSVLTVDFDEEGRLLSFIDPLDNLTRYEYDQAGRISRKTDPLNQRFLYQYDKKGRLSRLENQNGDEFTFQFDPVDRLIRTVGFDGKVRKYHYDKPTGLLFSMEDAGRKTHFEYDIMGQLLKRHAGDLTENFEYDISNRIIRAHNQYCDQRFEYDVLNNPIRETHIYSAFEESRKYVWENEFDEMSNRISTRRPDGEKVSWLRYGAGHVHGILLNDREVIAFDRDNSHREIRRHQSNSLVAVTAYDVMGRVKEQKLNMATGNRSKLRSRHYSYLKDGSLAGFEDSRHGTASYRYDALDRLISATVFDDTEIFSFDPASNLVEKDRAAVPKPDNTFPKNVSKVLGNILKRCAGMHFEYDAQGNLTSKRKPDSFQELEWDAFGRLSKTVSTDFRDNQVSEAKYVYDTFGRRIGKACSDNTSKPAVTFYGWDGQHLAFEDSSVGAAGEKTHYLYDDDSFVPLLQYRYGNSDQAMNSGPALAVNHYQCDHLGTPLLLTDDSGQIVWEGKYSVLGKQLAAGGESGQDRRTRNNLCFQGQYHDRESGFHYNRFRYYDPDVGRFIQQDPIGLLGDSNFYTYAPNSVNWIDPFGLMKGILRSTWNSIRRNYYKGKGGEVNHVPAFASYDGLDGAPTRGRGPAFWMEYDDHRAMRSTGSAPDAGDFRRAQRAHIRNGRWDQAIAMDIDDLNDKFPGKYNEDVGHLLDEHERQGNINSEQNQKLKDRLKNQPWVC